VNTGVKESFITVSVEETLVVKPTLEVAGVQDFVSIQTLEALVVIQR